MRGETGQGAPRFSCLWWRVSWNGFSVELVCSGRLHSLWKEGGEHWRRRTRGSTYLVPIYACNNVSNWPLWITGSLYYESWILLGTNHERRRPGNRSGLLVKQKLCCEIRNLQWSWYITDDLLDCSSAMFTKITLYTIVYNNTPWYSYLTMIFLRFKSSIHFRLLYFHVKSKIHFLHNTMIMINLFLD